jgi:hypothetical protein
VDLKPKFRADRFFGSARPDPLPFVPAGEKRCAGVTEAGSIFDLEQPRTAEMLV